jgi:PKD repeat protein
MNTDFLKNYRRLIFMLSMVVPTQQGNSQCAASFVSSYGSLGTSTFVSTSVNTSTSSIYVWSFGDATTFTATGSSGTLVAHTYTSNGIYNVGLNVNNVATGCISTATQGLVVFNAPFGASPCSVTVNVNSSSFTTACNGLATASSSNMCSPVSYSWSNGALGTSASGLCANVVYTVFATSSSSSNSCCATASRTFIAIVVPCNLFAAFTPTASAFGTNSVVFASNSTGTNAGTSYIWDFGDGTGPQNFGTNGASVVRTYTNLSATYITKLKVVNSASCRDSISQPITPSLIICNLMANFTATPTTTSGVFLFSSTSTGTLAGSTYTFNFNDGSQPVSGLSALSHTFNASGNYFVTLTVRNSSNCVSVATKTVSVNFPPVPCTINADFTHTVSTGGLVNFNSNSTGNVSVLNWDFGDGVYSSGNSVSHNYITNGAYNAKLRIRDTLLLNCKDSAIYSINITGLQCLANANFNLSPSASPQYWIAVPAYPWNVTAATWDWGDGNFSNQLYTSHAYNVLGNYNICLTTSVSCGASASVCVSSLLFNTQNAKGLMYINVKQPALTNSIAENKTHNFDFMVFPNPNKGRFFINAQINGSEDFEMTIQNLLGETVFRSAIEIPDAGLGEEFSTDLTKGIYFVWMSSGKTRSVIKMIVE